MKLNSLIPTVILIAVLVYGHTMLNKNRVPKNDMAQYIAVMQKIYSNSSNPAFSLDQNEREKITSWNKDAVNLFKSEIPVFSGIFRSIIENAKIIFPGIENKLNAEKISCMYYSFYLNFTLFCIRYSLFYFIGGIGIVLATFLLNKLGIYAASALIGKFCFFVSRFCITLTALIILISWTLIKPVFWLDAGADIFLGPMLILVFSCLILKIYDPNFPVWNRFLKNMILPITASSVMIYGRLIV